MGLKICEHLSAGLTLSQVCKLEGMPNNHLVWEWRRANPSFAQAYTRAREAGMEVWADQIVEIADDATTDYMTKEGKNGAVLSVVDHEHVTRSRLRIDTRKFLMAKIAPALYGDHVTVEHGGTVTHDHQISDKERARRMALFLVEGGAQAGAVIDGQAVATDSESPAGGDS